MSGHLLSINVIEHVLNKRVLNSTLSFNDGKLINN